MKKERGITLIALIITIIVLLILAGVALANITGEGSIFDLAGQAVEQSKIASKKDEIELAIVDVMLKKQGDVTIEEIIAELENSGIINSGDGDVESGQVKTQPDGYLYEITEENKGNWKVEYIGKGDVTLSKIIPVINDIKLEQVETGLKIEVDAEVGDGSISGTNTITFPLSNNELEIIGELTQATNATNGFKEENAYLVSTNEGVNSSKSDSYITIDLTEYDSTVSIPVTVSTTISSESRYDKGYVIITESAEVVTSYTEAMINGVSGTENHEGTDNLEGGKIYYLHFIYEKDSSSHRNEDNFKINNITIELPAELQYEYNVNNTGYTEKTDNNTYIYEIDSLNNIVTIGVRVTNEYGGTSEKTINYLEGITITPSTTEITKEDITVEVTWPSESENGTKQIKVGNNSWKTYGGVETISENCTVQARFIDSTNQIGGVASLTITNIDKTTPIVTAITDSVEIEEGESNEISNYFTCEPNGISQIVSVVYTDTSDGNKELNNTNELSKGTHTIKCTATKETGATASAMMKILVNPMVTAISDSIAIEEGESNEISRYFRYEENGISSVSYIDISDENKEVSNTNTLSKGTHIIQCTVIKETGASGNAIIKILVSPLVIASEWNGTIQTPEIMAGMTPMYWSTDGGVTASITEEGATEIYARIDENGKASSTGLDNPNFDWNNWYLYVAGDNETDTKTSRWANAVTDDGSYWVWIPRFKYKISDKPIGYSGDRAGKIEVEFIPTTDQTGTSGYTKAANTEGEILTIDGNTYIIHPAFENGSSTGKNNGYANGEWDSELPGFWIAKYEISGENASGESINPGNVAISDSVRMVSKPGVASWGMIKIGQMYQNCINYDKAKNSHMIKNSEWRSSSIFST